MDRGKDVVEHIVREVFGQFVGADTCRRRLGAAGVATDAGRGACRRIRLKHIVTGSDCLLVAVGVPAFRAPRVRTFVQIDSTFVSEDVVSYVVGGAVDRDGDEEAAPAKAFGVDVAVFVREEPIS